MKKIERISAILVGVELLALIIIYTTSLTDAYCSGKVDFSCALYLGMSLLSFVIAVAQAIITLISLFINFLNRDLSIIKKISTTGLIFLALVASIVLYLAINKISQQNTATYTLPSGCVGSIC